MSVTLACDRRSVDGALGAELIGAFKTLIENPVMMVVCPSGRIKAVRGESRLRFRRGQEPDQGLACLAVR
jgi:hypothetical protein